MNAIDSALDHAQAFVDFFVSNPVALVAVVTLFIAVFVFRKIRSSAPITKDDQRMFSGSQKAEAKRRAGMRCEHSAFGFRCSRPGEHADHVYPHSRGGTTSMSNCQSLCAPHNLRKSAQIPSKFYIARLQKRRVKYFPAGIEPRVEWRQGRSW